MCQLTNERQSPTSCDVGTARTSLNYEFNHYKPSFMRYYDHNLPEVKQDTVMSSEIITAKDYVKLLKQKYQGFEFPAYKLREWFSKPHAVFFDCRAPDTTDCLQAVLKKTDFEAFTIFFVVREQSGIYRFMDASFRNLGTETLDHFTTRFHSQLEPMTKLGVQATGLEYVECIGHSYVESSQ